MPSNFEEIQDYDSWIQNNPEMNRETNPSLQEEEMGLWDKITDYQMGFVRGASKAVENTLEIGQIFGLDYDVYDTEDIFGESKTMPASIAEGITEFATGFIPGLWGIGHLGKLAKVAKVTGKVKQAAETARKAGQTKKAALITGSMDAAKYGAAGAIADFTVFDAHEERLSNLIQSFPELQNPITDFLAADEEDSELMGRLKNAIEGAGIGFAIDGLMIGLRAMRKGVKHLPDKEKASQVAQEESERLYQEGEQAVLYDVSPNQTQTEEFKNWFGDSKVVDEDGKPLMVFHGTKREFSEFKTRFPDVPLMFFTTDPKFASDWMSGTGGVRQASDEVLSQSKKMLAEESDLYEALGLRDVDISTEAGLKEYDRIEQKIKDHMNKKYGFSAHQYKSKGGTRVIPAYLSVQKMFEPQKHWDQIKLPSSNPEFINAAKRGAWPVYETKEVVEQIRKLGYDGIRLSESGLEGSPLNTIAVFSPEQIKSATGNRGTFDPADPNILRDVSPESGQKLDEMFEVDPEPKKIPTYSDEYPVPQGLDAMKNRINREVTQGSLTNEEAQFAHNLLDRMNQSGVLSGEGIRFRKAKNLGGDSPAGTYDPEWNVISIAKETVSEGGFKGTFIHELWHAVDNAGFIDPAYKKAMKKDLLKARKSFAKKHGIDFDEYFSGKADTTEKLLNLGRKNNIEKEEWYRLTAIHEWVAETMKDATFTRLDLEEDTKSFIKWFRLFVHDFLTEVKATFGKGTYDKVAKDFFEKGEALRPGVKRETMLDTSTMAGMGRPVLADIDPKQPAKSIEDLENGAEILANMAKLSRAEIEEIAKDKSINWETLSTSPDVVQALRVIGAKNVALKEKAQEVVSNEEFLKKTIESTEQLKDAGILSPGDITKVDDMTRLAESRAEDIRQASMFRQFMAEELNNFGQEVNEIAKRVAETGDRDSALRFMVSKHGIERLQVAYKTVSSEFGRGLQAHKVTPGEIRSQLDEINLEDVLSDQAARDDFIDSLGGIDKVRAEAEKFMAAMDAGNTGKAVGLIKNKDTWGAAIIEYWMNSILSGPTTQFVNALSGVLTTAIAPLEKAMGAASRGDIARAGRELKRYVYLFSSVNDARKVAWMSLKDNKAVLDPMTSSIREGQYGPSKITNRMLDTRLANSSAGVEAARWAGTLTNLPSRFLTGMDEFFKQINYRSAMKAGLAEKAIKDGMTDSREIAEYVSKQFDRLIDEGQYLSAKKFRKEARELPEIKAIAKPMERAAAIQEYVEAEMKAYSPLAEAARGHAREVTFTTPLEKERGTFIGISRSISNLANENPLMRMVFPFVRTPANIIQYVMDRTPLTMLNKRQRQAFLDWKKQAYSDSPEIRQEAIGRMMMGTTFLTTGYMLAMNGNLTGGGPTDPSRRKILQDAGWQPYAVKVGDSYYSYRRMDPFASFFGVMADVADAFAHGDERTRREAEGVALVTLISMAKNLTDKTYLTGMTRVANALSDPERFGSSWMNSTIASFVPNILQQTNRSFDQDVKDINGPLDAIMQKIPGWSKGVAPRRNMFGEPLTYQRAGIPVIDSISPFDYSETDSDPIKQELSRLGHGFSPPRSLKNGVELTEYFNDSGQSAYDKWAELHGKVRIGGRTLKDALSRLIRSRSYKRLAYESIDDLDSSPRALAIKRILSKYRAKAFTEMLREFPEVRQKNEIGILVKQYRRAGRDASQLMSLIER